jgi:hypothetical protein
VHSDTLARRVDRLRSRLGLGGIAAIDDNRTTFRDESGRDLLADPEAPPVTIATLSWKRICYSPVNLPIDRSTTISAGNFVRQGLSIDRERSGR